MTVLAVLCINVDKLPWQNALDADLEKKFGRTLPRRRELRVFASRILGWYEDRGRKYPWRKSRFPIYQVVITEALLQRTRADVVAKFLPEFLDQYPDWQALHAARVSSLERSLEPIGLHKRRAKSLSSLANEVIELGGRVPSDPLALFRLPGVGQYLFYAINLYRHDAPMPLLDAGMARVLERHFGARNLADIRYDPYLQQLAHGVVAAGNSKRINWAILDIGALVCVKNRPRCDLCPVSSTCLFHASVD